MGWNNQARVSISALYPLLWVLLKCFDTQTISALCWPAHHGYRAQSAGVPSESSPSARRGHVGPAAACTHESPALR